MRARVPGASVVNLISLTSLANVFAFFLFPSPTAPETVSNPEQRVSVSAVLRLRAQSLMQASIQSVSLPSIHPSRELNDIRLMPPQAV